jgi:hypothetical protein
MVGGTNIENGATLEGTISAFAWRGLGPSRNISVRPSLTSPVSIPKHPELKPEIYSYTKLLGTF